MELERNDLNYSSNKRVDYKSIIGGISCLLLAILVGILVYKWDVIFTALQGNWMQVFKGSIVGISFLPAFIFVGIKVQDRNRVSRSNKPYINNYSVNVRSSKSICLLISAVLGICYSIYIIMHFGSAMNENELAGSLATVLVAPHIFMTLGATIVILISYFKNSSSMALIGSILFSVGGLLFIMYIPFLVPSIILGFVGFDKVRKLKMKE